MDFAVSFMPVLPFLSCLPPSLGNRLLERECCVRMRLKNKVFSKSVKPQVDRNKCETRPGKAPCDSLAISD